MEVAIVIPTMGRAKTMTTHKVVNGCIICCPESQADEYLQENPGITIDAHPDDIKGLPKKRQWIYDKYRNVQYFDDDITKMRRLTSKAGESEIVSPDKAYDIVQANANLAKIAGCVLFGFNHYKDPRLYPGHRPFRLSGFVNAVSMGLLEEGHDKLYFNTNITTNGDFFMSALNAHFFRKCWVDDRYVLDFKEWATGDSGSAMLRNSLTEKADTEELQRCFGTEVITIKPEKTAIFRSKHQNAKQLNLPF